MNAKNAAKAPTSSPETPQKTLVNPVRLLAEAALRNPQKLSLVESWGEGNSTQTRTWSIAEAWNNTCALAQTLTELGVRSGDLVTVVAHNSAWHLIAYVACTKIGATFSPLSWRLTAAELTAAWEYRTPRLIICEDHTADAVKQAAAKCRKLPAIIKAEELKKRAATETIDPKPTAENTPPAGAALLFTSGSTGKPKPVALSHQEMWWAWQNFRAAFAYSNQDVTVAVAPFSHIGGFNGTTNDLFINGGTVIIERDFNPQRLLRNITQYRATMMFAVPTMYHQLVNHTDWENADLTSWRIPLIGGSPPPPPLLQKLIERGLTPINVYGMTETGGAGACTSPELTGSHPHSVGRPFPYIEATLLERQENGEGILALRGPGVIRAYPDDPTDSENRFRDGWLVTGDVARWDGTNLCIIGRCTDTIISGGENIHPSEIETALNDLPGIEACLIVPEEDPEWGQKLHLVAQTKAKLTLEKVRAHLQHKLARYKHPRALTIVEQLPLNRNGKPDRVAAAAIITKKPR